MGLETATYISGLNPSNPVGAVDPKSQGDDHLRLIKSALLATFPNITGAITATHTQLNTVGASGITGFANPSALAKLTAVNGAALTAMRSDAAPAIDQTIAPTWSGAHTFSATAVFTNAIGWRIAHAAPYVELQESDQAATEQYWSLGINAKTLSLAAMTGSGTGASNALAATRGAGNVISTITLGNATDNPGMTFAGTGGKTHNGDATFNASAVGSAPLTINGVSAGQAVLKYNINGVAKGYVGAVGAAGQLGTGTVAGDFVIRNDGGQAILISADAGATMVQRMTNALLRNTAPLVELSGIHNGTATATTACVASGTWSPTLTNVANTSALANKGAWNWSRVGNVVNFSGQFDHTPAALVRSQVRVSLPIASNFTAQFHATGLCTPTVGTASTQPMQANGGTVSAVAATDDLLCDWVETINTTAKTLFVHGQYLVL